MRTLLPCLLALCALGACDPKSGFILTAPKHLDSGSTEYLTFTAVNVPPGGTVSIQLLHWHTRELMAESKVLALNNMNTGAELVVPPSPLDVRARLRVRGTFGGGHRAEGEREVLVRRSSVVTFIQTDKPVYKPGQTVRFRVLPLDSQLKPLELNKKGDIWIQDPSDVHVAQWKQIKFDEGIIQLEMPLSTEPPLGTWKIGTKINEVTAHQNFEVQKYVLPKFEVKVKPPAFVMADADIIPLEVCAWYTYGKKVDGTFKVKVTYKPYSWEKKNRAIPSIKYSGLISGCETINIHTPDILMQTHEYGYRTLNLFAIVTENGTGTEGNASALLDITHSPLKLTFLGPERDSDYFKPGLPYFGTVLVTKPDGYPVANEKVEICAHYHDRAPSYYNPPEARDRRCHLFTSSRKGVVRFSVAPVPASILKIAVVAEAISYDSVQYAAGVWRDKLVRPSSTLELRAWYSPSGHYLQIQPRSGEMECDSREAVMVRFTVEKGVTVQFYHQVLSRGRIVQQGSHQRFYYEKEQQQKKERYDLLAPDTPPPRLYSAPNATEEEPEIGEFLLSFDPRATMSPAARLLVFYVRDDGEVVADSRLIRIARCLRNKVNFHFRHEQQYPSTEATMMLSATPHSLCGIGLVDKSVRLLRPEEQFTKEKIFQIMEQYDVGKGDRPRQVNESFCDRDNPESPPVPRVDDGLFAPFSRSVSYHVDTAMAFEEAGMVVMSNFQLESRPCVASQPVAIVLNMEDDRRVRIGLPGAGDVSPRGSAFELPRAPSPRPKDPDPAKEPPKPSEADEIRNYFPETWLWEMHSVGPSGQTVVKRQLPHTITQWVGGAVCVSPKSGLGLWEESSVTAFQPFFVSFVLPYAVVRGEVLPLTVSVFNYLSECLPIQLSLEESAEYRILSESRRRRLCVCGGESRSHRFALAPSALGRVNVTVYGFSLEDDDEAVCGNEVTARLGARDALSKQLRVEAEGFPKEEVFNYFVCPENTNGTYATEVDLLLPEDVVEGSARAFISVTGDLLGPALSGLGGLVRLPVGCGEQNMVLFTPNVFVLDYLTATGRLTDRIREECVHNLKTGFQREMRYRHRDGSFSAFGPGDAAGSLWLTAFVVRSFARAMRFVELDFFVIAHSTDWILGRQRDDGCFEPAGPLLNKAMQGGLRGGEHSAAPLTAYVMIALLEAGTQRAERHSIRSALRCLETESSPGTYALALFAYAAALANEKRAARHYLQRLEERAVVRGSLTYWESPSAEGGSKSVDVEIAGYYVLTRTKLDGRESSTVVLPVVRWIIQQRNAHGGFVSTQDTVIGLQALAQHSALHSSQPLDLGLVVESEGLVRGFKVDEESRLLMQDVRVPVLPAVVDLQAVGDGCALVQFSLRYNVERVSGSEALQLSVGAVRLRSSCDRTRLDICIRYRIPDEKTNMAVVSVKMPSGFVPDEWSLYELQSDPDVQLKRHELDGNRVNLYFNELTSDQKCFKFFIKSETEVEEMKPSSVQLYDYYQPDLEVSKDFEIPSACSGTDFAPTSPDVLKMSPPTFPIDETYTLPALEHASTTEPSPDPELPTLLVPASTAEPTDDSTAEGTEAATSEGPAVVTTVADELADDASLHRSESNASRLVNFVDVPHDLEFPDGIEGNVPVSVLPTTTETPPSETPTADTPTCPTCTAEFPEDFNDIYCNSAFALRVTVRDGSAGTVKILQDASYSLPQPRPMKRLARLEYDRGCQCPQLQQKGSVHFIVGTPTDLWSSKQEKHRIRLTNQVHVISTPLKTLQAERLKTARKTCSSDP